MTTPVRTTDWSGTGSTRLLPPPVYWDSLVQTFPAAAIAEVRQLSDRRVNELRVSDLGTTADDAVFEKMVGDGWLVRETRRACANGLCDHEPTDDDIAAGICPSCGEAITAENVGFTVYVRDLAPTRDVDWVVVIHGMNTKGAWQEEFSWFLGTTWGKSVPVAIYKYGIIIAGVIMAWRRRLLQRRLRAKLAELRSQARKAGYGEVPDVIAHSFGTWLIGHLLEDEIGVDDPLRFGRVIMTGCVLRPDYDWAAAKRAGLVTEVLNHYATKDPIVPLAHWTIWDSGPSGRRGFDDIANVINVRAEGLKHSDLFSTDRCIINGKQRQKCPPTGARGSRHLDHTYETHWRPFLTLPSEELTDLPDIAPPTTPWRQASAPLRGTLFPFVALPLVAALVLVLAGWIGGPLSRMLAAFGWTAAVTGAGLGLLLIGIAASLGLRRMRGSNANKGASP